MGKTSFNSIKIYDIKSFNKQGVFETYKSDGRLYALEDILSVVHTKDLKQAKHAICRNPDILNRCTCISTPIGETFNLIVVRLSNNADDKAFPFTSFQFLLSMLYSIGGKTELYFYKECPNKSGNDNPQRDGDYYRIAEYLNMWIRQNKHIGVFYYEYDTESNCDIDYVNNEEYGDSERILYRKEIVSEKFFPIIEIDEQTYKILDATYDESNNKRNIGSLWEYILSFIDKLISKIHYRAPEIDDFLRAGPSILTVALFVAYISNYYDGGNNDRAVIPYEVITEKCYSYSQGVLQLLENAYRHVVKKDKNNKALFSFFLHRSIKGLDRYTQKGLYGETQEHTSFFEFLITDLDCDDCVGILDNFNKKLKETTYKINRLEEVFDYPTVQSDVLDEFYKSPENVSLHYGLQIFASVVSANDGIIILQSGNERDYKNYVNNKTPIEFDQQHFSGTEYSIILPISDSSVEKTAASDLFLGNMRPLNDDYITDMSEIDVVDLKKIGNSTTVVDEYYAIMRNASSKDVSCFDVNAVDDRKHIEYICKAAFRLLTSDNDKQISPVNTVCLINFANKFRILDAFRMTALFYNKVGFCNLLKNKCMFLSMLDGESNKQGYELFFGGNNLRHVAEDISVQKLVKQFDSKFLKTVETALRPRLAWQKANNKENNSNEYENILSPLLLKYFIKARPGLTVKCDSLLQNELKHLLINDVHDDGLGCRTNCHIRIGKVHLNTFYEAQFLFGNAYWTNAFALYLYREIRKIIDDSDSSEGETGNCPEILLYGYETYTALALHKTQELLIKDKAHIKGNVEMRIFERDGVNCGRIRYAVNNDNALLDKAQKTSPLYVFYVVGISSTLSTFGQMYSEIVKKVNKKYGEKDAVKSFCLSVLQVCGEGSENFIERDKAYAGGEAFKCCKNSSEDFLSFAEGNRAVCYVSVDSKWYAAEQGDCELCIPKNYLDEQPLIEVDDTSVVPAQMIEPNRRSHGLRLPDVTSSSRKNANDFLKDTENRKYLYYEHIERNGNHFQYYIRPSELYKDKKLCSVQDGLISVEGWLNSISESLRGSGYFSDASLPDENPDTGDANRDFNKAVVNVLIAPQNFANTGFVQSVNKCIFNGTAHMIEFDVRKEYRSSFQAKYSNYKEWFGKRMKPDDGYIFNFYFVNDQIISGDTFHRADSLVNSLIEDYNLKRYGKVRLFRGVFTLIDRNSDYTRSSYVDVYTESESKISFLPFFSYLRFDVPSLRSHDDSCSLCKQIAGAQSIADSSALNGTAEYWQERVVYYRVKHIQDVYKDEEDADNRNPEKYDVDKIRAFRRLQCENDLWLAIKTAEELPHVSEKREENVYRAILHCITARYNSLMPGKPIYDVLSLPQSTLFDTAELEKTIADEKYKPFFDLTPQFRYTLFKVIITRLCAMGSCALLDKERLQACRAIGEKLYNESKKRKQRKETKKNEFAEYFISYLKTMSRPLLIYRENVKKAVLRLLLECLDVFLNLAESGADVESFDLRDTKKRLGDLSEFDRFLLNSVKRLFGFDRGTSKANRFDRVFIKNDGTPVINDRFYRMLYIENNRCEILDKHNRYHDSEYIRSAWEGDKKIQDFDKDGNVKEKYEYIIDELKEIAVGKNGKSIRMAIFALYDEKESLNHGYSMIAGDKSVRAPDKIVEEIEFPDSLVSNKYFYVKIGNNYNKLMSPDKDFKYSKTLYEELGLFQEASIVIGVDLSNNVNCYSILRKILAYRKEILCEVEKDFNNGVVQKLIQTEILVAALSEAKSLTHTSAPFEPLGKILDSFKQDWENYISANNQSGQCECKPELTQKDRFYHVVSAFQSFIIPLFYRDLVKRTFDDSRIKMWSERNDKGKVVLRFYQNTIDRSPTLFKAQFRIDIDRYKETIPDGVERAAKCILFAAEMIRYKNSEQQYNISFNFYDENNCPQDLIDCSADDIYRLFDGVIYFNPIKVSNIPFTFFMFLDAFLENVKKHAGHTNATVDLRENGNSGIDLTVTNSFDSEQPEHEPGMTLYAFANYFGYDGADINANPRLPTICWVRSDKQFVISIKNLFVRRT